MYSIRRHLSKGKYFGHFQIRRLNGNTQKEIIEYVDGTKYSLIMNECKLYNSDTISNNIFIGKHNKKPCAWVQCKSYEILPSQNIEGKELIYNPKINPFWVLDEKNVNGLKADIIFSKGYKVYIL
mgnify:FL=1